MASNENWLKRNDRASNNAETKFNRQFVLSVASVEELANTIILPDFIGVLKNFFSKPEDWLSSLIYFPMHFKTGSPVKLKILNYPTNILAYEHQPSSSWYNMGEWYCEPYFNNFADYNGYTKIEVFLPYLGFVEIMPNDVMGKWVQFRLKIDTMTGLGIYYIGVSNNSIVPVNPPFADEAEDFRVIGVHTTQIGIQIPLGTTNTTEIYRNIALGAVKAVSGAVSSYAMYKAGVGISTSTTTSTKTTSGTYDRFSPTTHRPLKGGTWSRTEGGSSTRTYDNQSYLKGRAITEAFSAGEQALSAMHLSVGIDKPNNPLALVNAPSSIQIVIKRPKFIDIGDDFKHLYGLPNGSAGLLHENLGYAEITEVHIEGEAFSEATQSELAQLQDELLNGVIL